ncbi:1-deoxy-D-xylulose-5-phosphate synthase N-terminal domain-containing protein [Actinomadura sp. DC4]|uniref:1-deoxy-D-xylulose-5-phosphate synthase N-terminal domain-containing protein n=1 Tax=Actinomadura sp. DC4 TaxID=3055069 RepID=UPI00339D7F22
MGIMTSIRGPRDLKALDGDQLSRLSEEIRAFLADAAARTGGPLGPNLGMVELTVALHRVFDAPRDRIVFDTGHQSHVHELLAGRQDRKSGPSHDGAANRRTALGWADGLAKAARDRSHVVAVTGGTAWEALDGLAGDDRPLVIVVNDGGGSSHPVGQDLRYLGPVDGHDVTAVEAALRRAKDLPGPVVVHCVTEKGRERPGADGHAATPPGGLS